MKKILNHWALILVAFFVLTVLIHVIWAMSNNSIAALTYRFFGMFFSFILIIVILVLKYKYDKNTKRMIEMINHRNQIRLRDTNLSTQFAQTLTYLWEIDNTGKITYISSNVQEILGYEPKTLIGTYIWDLHPEEGKKAMKETVVKTIEEGSTMIGLENEVMTKSEETLWVLTGVLPIYDTQGNITGQQGWDTNITEQKEMERAIVENEKRLREMFDGMEEAFALHKMEYDSQGHIVNYRLIDVNPSYEKYTGIKLEEAKGKLITDIFNVERPPFFNKYKTVSQTQKPVFFTRYFAPLKRYFRVSIFSPRPGYTASVYMDISEQKQLKESIENLSYKDKLTGLYNRRYYEEQVPFLASGKNLPLSLILCDMNALKLANDAFGHQLGDEVIQSAADIIKAHVNKRGFAARIGGDEFALLLPDTDYKKGHAIMSDMMAQTQEKTFGHIELSMSFGLATLEDEQDSFESVYKRAEEKMYRHKLSEGPNVRQRIFKNIIAYLFEQNDSESEHAKNTETYALALGKFLKLSKASLKTLQYAARWHDIGKVAIDAKLLRKKGELNEVEWIQMKRHAEIGYRILSALNDKAYLADIVLDHHENVDGTGYPRKRKGDEIHELAKIIRVVESYEAMVGGLYQKPIKKDQAIDELIKGKDTLYDAQLVEAFIKII